MTCKKCQLHESATQPVHGSGNPKANLFLVGEAPGYNEDRLGLPFIGQAGTLLDHILTKLSLDREQLFITNAIRCRPPNNKLPPAKQLNECWNECAKYWIKEVKAVKPKVILLMGNTPLKLIAGVNFISKNEGAELPLPAHFPFKVRLFASYHPAFALRTPKHEASIARVIYVAAKAAGLKPKPLGVEAGCFEYELRG